MESLREHDSQTDAEKVSRLLDEYRGNGLAVVGVADTLTALLNGQADDLLISAAPGEITYDEGRVKQILAAYGTEGEPGTDVSEPRMVADEMVKRAQASSASVTFIEDASLLAEVGGVGATLRYRIEKQ
jgi:peptide subunit release factor 1 (eRF1)